MTPRRGTCYTALPSRTRNDEGFPPSAGGECARNRLAGPDDKRGGDGDDGRSDLARAYQKAGPYMAASTQLVVAVGLGTWVGWWGDQKLGHRVPWMLLVGAGLGMLGGFVSFFRTVLGKGKGK